MIKTEEENEKALAIVEELMHRPNRTLEENELYELLVTLIEKFEQEYYVYAFLIADSAFSRLIGSVDKATFRHFSK